ncbi:hypothetical protein B0H14DRAFT_3751873 [Mycena olivaceomarginata]|nr:hypothetical protein B0H14DRAFT_3751873 [Mycena olivaceomarginata]
MLPWGLAKQGVSDSEPFHSVWRLLGPNWLEGSQMNDMLELLRHKINTHPDLVRNTRVSGTALVPKILQAYRAAGDGTYWMARDLQWIRDLGDDLVQNRAALLTSAHLGPVTDEPHWVGIVFDCRDKPVVRYGDSFKSPIPAELLAACTWWLGQHTMTLAPVEHAELPIARQQDGHSRGMLVNNAHEHFIDPSVPLDGPTHVANARLQIFNKIATRGLEQLEIERQQAIAGDEDSDDRSDQITATPPALDSDADSDASPVLLLRRTARQAKLTFASPFPPSIPSPLPASPARAAGTKRPKGHADAPTPNPSPQKHRIFKRLADDTIPALPQLIFSPRTSPSTRNTNSDIFGPVTCCKTRWLFDRYRGPEDDALLPPESQMESQATVNGATLDSTDDLSYADLPGLQDISDSEAGDSDNEGYDSAGEPMPNLEDVDNSDDEAMLAHAARAHTPPQPVPHPLHRCEGQSKNHIVWKVETAEEKAVRRENDARMYAERVEEMRLREVNEKRKKKASDRVNSSERMQRHRDRVRDAKLAEGWVPGTKRLSVSLIPNFKSCMVSVRAPAAVSFSPLTRSGCAGFDVRVLLHQQLHDSEVARGEGLAKTGHVL